MGVALEEFSYFLNAIASPLIPQVVIVKVVLRPVPYLDCDLWERQRAPCTATDGSCSACRPSRIDWVRVHKDHPQQDSGDQLIVQEAFK